MYCSDQFPVLLLKEPQAAKALGISPRKLFDLRKSGEIPYVQVGKRSIGYCPKQLEAYIASRQQLPEPSMN